MKAPGIAKILKADPSADASLFGVYKLGDVERRLTPPPPLSGVLDFGDLEPYRCASKARRGKKSKGRKPKAAPVPVVEQDSSVETDVSEPVTPASDLWPAHPVSPPTDPGVYHYPHSSTSHGEFGLQNIPPATDASDACTLNNQSERSGSFLDDGQMVDSRLAVRSMPPLPPSQSVISPITPIPPIPPLFGAFPHPSVQFVAPYEHNLPSGFPAAYAAHSTAGPSTDATHGQAQEGYLAARTEGRTSVLQPPLHRTQGGRGPHHQRYNPYVRRPAPQTALRNQVVGQGSPAIPAHPVDPFWGATPHVGQVVQNHTGMPAMSTSMSRGEDFIDPLQVTRYYATNRSNVNFDQPETMPIWNESSWSAPPLDGPTSAISHPSATMYGGWSPSDEGPQALQDMTDHAYYNDGPSTSRRV